MRNSSERALGYRAFQVLNFVRETIDARGYAPSYREIMLELGITTRGEVSRIVSGLERRRLLSRVADGRVRRLNIANR